MTNSMQKKAALEYARRGWSVIPLSGKKPLIAWKDYQAKCAAEAQIEAWWQKYPSANVGIVTGAISGLVVLDVDAPEGIKTLAAHNYTIPETVIKSKTGGGGYHCYFAHPGYLCKNFAGGRGLLPGVDFRGDGGYIVAPPAVHQNGKVYKWIVPPGVEPVLPMPSWLERLIHAHVGDSKENWKEQLLEGERNTGLTRRAGSLLKDGLRFEHVLSIIQALNQKYCKPPLSDDEAEAIVISIARRHAGRAKADKKPTQAQLLVGLANEVELFHTADRKGYATIPVGGHRETWGVQSQPFRRWLLHRYFLTIGRPPNAQAVRDAVGVLDAKAEFDGPELQVFKRVAQHDGNIYIDLGCPTWDAIEVTPSGWQVVPSTGCPVKFWRTPGMLPLTRPGGEADITALRCFLNTRNDTDWYLLVAWLLAALHPRGPYPILVLQGEQGSAKSTTAKVLSVLVDPSTPQLRLPPGDARDLAIAATNTWVMAVDNLSSVPAWLSDAFCCMATEGGFVTRRLYSDDEETRFNFSRPIVINGIEAIVTRHDLLDRSVVITLPAIPDTQRQDDTDFWTAFEQARPGILAALLTAVAAGLYSISTVKLDSLPRMAGFAKWVTACESALPWPQGDFLKAYAESRAEAVEAALEGDVVVSAIRGLLEQQPEWEGTMTELLAALEGYVSEQVSKGRGWPKTVKALGRKLRLSVTFLRQVGVEVEFARKAGGGAKENR